MSKFFFKEYLEPLCCKKRQKRPNQETGLENEGYQIDPNDAHIGPIWYRSEHSDFPIPQTKVGD